MDPDHPSLGHYADARRALYSTAEEGIEPSGLCFKDRARMPAPYPRINRRLRTRDHVRHRASVNAVLLHVA